MTDPVPTQSRLRRWREFRPRVFKMTRFDPGRPGRTVYVVAWGGQWRWEFHRYQ